MAMISDKVVLEDIKQQKRWISELLRLVNPSVIVLQDSSTPSISYSKVYTTGGTTTITNLMKGDIGQEITIISAHSVTITDGTNIFLSGSVNYAMTASDTLTLIRSSDGFWYEKSRSVN